MSIVWQKKPERPRGPQRLWNLPSSDLAAIKTSLRRVRRSAPSSSRPLQHVRGARARQMHYNPRKVHPVKSSLSAAGKDPGRSGGTVRPSAVQPATQRPIVHGSAPPERFP